MTETEVQTEKPWQETTRATIAWWKTLGENRGDRAELRRCRSPTEVAFVPAFYRLKTKTPQNLDPERLAAVAGVLSHLDSLLETDGRETIAGFFARPAPGGSTPRISDPRFRRLLRVPDDDYTELYPMLTRIIRQVDRKIPQYAVTSLIWGVYRWDQATKRSWAEAYYEHVTRNED
ncbi:MAG: type I-E CRISPR-associated protein Cse2/CasB [Massilibacteroides sp.]|nr:type I-E CRISPR-associated protein Cse2/CasB [Massilibacteroides sp.]